MNRLFDRLRGEINDLNELNETAAARSGELEHLAGGLSAEVQALRKEITAGRVFTSAVEKCCASLRRVVATAEPGSASMTDDFLTRFKERYTMDAERGIHSAVLAPTTPGSEEMAFVAGAASEFGDNVELF